jgi:hypothetical protein
VEARLRRSVTTRLVELADRTEVLQVETLCCGAPAGAVPPPFDRSAADEHSPADEHA